MTMNNMCNLLTVPYYMTECMIRTGLITMRVFIQFCGCGLGVSIKVMFYIRRMWLIEIVKGM